MAEKIIAEYELRTDKFRQQVKGVAEDLDKVGKEGKSAGEATSKSFDKASSSANRLSKETKDAESPMKSLKGAALQLGAALGIAFGVDQLVNFTKESIRAAAFQQQQQALLLAALKGREDVQQRLIKQAEELQQRTVYDAEVINQQQTFLANQGRTEEQINKTIEAAVQLSAVTGDDLATSVQKLDQTYEGSIGRLGRLDEGFKNLTKEQLANGGAMDLIIQKYGGFAEAQAKTLDGQLKQLENSFGDIQEEIGKAFIPTIESLVKGLKNTTAAFDFGEVFKEVQKIFETLIEPTKIAIDTYSTLFSVFSKGSTPTEKTVGVLEVLNIALKVLLLPTKLIIQAFNDIVHWFVKAYEEGGFLTTVVDGIGTAFSTVYNTVKDLLGIEQELETTQKGLAASIVKTAKALNEKTNATSADNEEDKKKISILQQVQKEIAAITERITEQALTGGPISQKDIDRLTFLNGKLDGLKTKLEEVKKITGSEPIVLEAVTDFASVIGDEAKKTNAIVKASVDESKLYLEQVSAELAESLKNNTGDVAKTFEEQVQSLNSTFSEIGNQVANIAGLVGQFQQLQRDEITRTYDTQINAIQNSELSEKEKAKKIEALRKQQAKEEYELQLKQFKINKAIAIVQAVINTAQAVTSQLGAGPVVGFVLAALAAATGAAQIGLIAAQQPPPPAFAEGTDFVQRGKNKAGVDTIPAYLNEGEAVIPTDKNKAYPGLAKAWIAGNLDDYIVRNFVAPKLIDMERKAEKRMADSFAASLKGDGFDDARLLMATSEGNMYLKTIAKEMKTKQKKRTAW